MGLTGVFFHFAPSQDSASNIADAARRPSVPFADGGNRAAAEGLTDDRCLQDSV
jgi:hypothetical protein